MKNMGESKMRYQTPQDDEILSISDTQTDIQILGCAVSSVGMVRGNNEDSVQLWVFEPYMLGLVADGMGGAAGGEEASRLAVEAVQDGFVESLPDSQLTDSELSDKMRMALSKANQSVIDMAAQNHELQGMGTTATLVLLHTTHAIFAHIGDSRGYWIDGSTGNITRVTSDHSFVEALVISGHLTRQQAAEHPMKNVLYRALGQKGETELEIDILSQDLHIGDRLILCSDGLPRHLEDEKIAEISLAYDSPRDIAQNLIDLTNERGGEDNVSVIVFVLKSK
jgi:PPM family protein phosphatase